MINSVINVSGDECCALQWKMLLQTPDNLRVSEVVQLNEVDY